MRFLLRTGFCLVVLAALVLPANLLHAQVTYTVTGFANTLGDPDVDNLLGDVDFLSPEVAVGESYVAEFEVDLSAADVDSSPDRGEFPGAIISSSIVFSGGYISQVDFTGGQIVIQRDLAGGGIFFSDPSGLGVILIADVGDAFETDALFDDIEDQFLGDPMGDLVSLFSLTEPSGNVFSVSQAPDLGLGPMTGPILLSVSTPVLAGDVNRDGAVDFFDIDPFIDVLTTQNYQDEADLDQNGIVNFFDIDPFVTVLSSQN